MPPCVHRNTAEREKTSMRRRTHPQLDRSRYRPPRQVSDGGSLKDPLRHPLGNQAPFGLTCTNYNKNSREDVLASVLFPFQSKGQKNASQYMKIYKLSAGDGVVSGSDWRIGVHHHSTAAEIRVRLLKNPEIKRHQKRNHRACVLHYYDDV